MPPSGGAPAVNCGAPLLSAQTAALNHNNAIPSLAVCFTMSASLPL
jgi:hypothetical protein